MVPPGAPDWLRTDRCVDEGAWVIKSHAWTSMRQETAKIEFGINGAWEKAPLTGRNGKYAWTGWEYEWKADPEQHILQ